MGRRRQTDLRGDGRHGGLEQGPGGDRCFDPKAAFALCAQGHVFVVAELGCMRLADILERGATPEESGFLFPRACYAL